MKYSIKQEVIDRRGNRGMIVDIVKAHGKVFYQVLFDKDWNTGAADFVPEKHLKAVDNYQKAI